MTSSEFVSLSTSLAAAGSRVKESALKPTNQPEAVSR